MFKKPKKGKGNLRQKPLETDDQLKDVKANEIVSDVVDIDTPFEEIPSKTVTPGITIIPDISSINLAKRKRAQKRNLFTNSSSRSIQKFDFDMDIDLDGEERSVMPTDNVNPNEVTAPNKDQDIHALEIIEDPMSEVEEEEVEWQQTQLQKVFGGARKVISNNNTPLVASSSMQVKVNIELNSLNPEFHFSQFVDKLDSLKKKLESESAEIESVRDMLKSEKKIIESCSKESLQLKSDILAVKSFEAFLESLSDMVEEKTPLLLDLESRFNDCDMKKECQVLMEDVDDEFASIESIIKQFWDFREKFPQKYDQCYGSMALPDACDFHIRLEIASWNPLIEDIPLDSLNWIKSFMKLILDYPAEDFGGDLIPALIVKYVSPHVLKVISVWDIGQSNQSKRLADLIDQVSDYVSADETSRLQNAMNEKRDASRQ